MPLMFDQKTRLALKNGEPDAFRKVFRLLYPRLKGYCKLFIADKEQAEDIIQESFISLWEKRKTIDPLKSVENFIFIIVRNRCLNYLRQKNLEEGKISLDNIQVAELQYLYNLDFKQKEEKSLEELLIQSFQQTIDELPEKMKNVFIKCKIEGKKQQEVADELSISIKMVEKHIAKAKEHIREKLINKFPELVIIISLLID